MDFTLMASYGRSGSTMLMKMLSMHPSFAIRTRFPYETRTSQFLVAASNETSSSERDDATFQRTSYHIAQHGDHEMINVVRSMRTLNENPLDAAEVIYRKLPEVAAKDNAKFITEKSIGVMMLNMLLQNFPHRTRGIMLLRDPRSIYFSVKSFNEKRQRAAFGSESGDASLFEKITSFLTLMKKIQSMNTDRVTIIMYEDLVSSPVDAIRPLLELHGIAPNDSEISAMIAAMHEKDTQTEHHSTVNLQDSLCRWKMEASTDDMKLFAQKSDAISALGY